MLTFNQYIQELFNRPYPYDLIIQSENELMYMFRTPTQKFTVSMYYNGLEKIWEISFTDKNQLLGLTGRGGKETSSIFATVMATIDDFIKKKKPKKIYFSADKEDGNRSKLYATLVKQYTPKGYNYTIDDKAKTTHFTLEKK